MSRPGPTERLAIPPSSDVSVQQEKMAAVGRLAGGVAHYFNNFLTVINGYADLLLDDLGEEAACTDSIRAIRRAGERAAAMTQQLLTFAGKQIVTPRLLDLNAVVAAASDLLRRLLGEGVSLTTDLQPQLGRVRADPAQLQQVLLNLAANARVAMPEGGQLAITTREAAAGDSRQVVLSVADTGHGMTEEVRRHLFEPFFTTKEVGQGLGLGLATVYGIVTQLGGHIDVQTSPGAGTTFRIALPRAADPESAACSAPEVPAGRETVLLADDEDAVRELARQALFSAGYNVLEACDGVEALSLAERHPGRIDLLVSDVVMPGLGGRQLADRLQARDSAVKVLYLSGYVPDELLRHGVSRSEVHFLAKPFSPGALAQKVREVLEAEA
jgi:CheY-like chemotaxis protein